MKKIVDHRWVRVLDTEDFLSLNLNLKKAAYFRTRRTRRKMTNQHLSIGCAVIKATRSRTQNRDRTSLSLSGNDKSSSRAFTQLSFGFLEPDLFKKKIRAHSAVRWYLPRVGRAVPDEKSPKYFGFSSGLFFVV